MRPAQHPQQNRHRLIGGCMRSHNDIGSALAGSIYQPCIPVVTGLLLIPAHSLSVTYFRRDTAACRHVNDIVSIRIRFCPAHPVVVMQHANWQREVPGACQCGEGKKGGETVRAS